MVALVDANQACKFGLPGYPHLDEFVRWVVSGGRIALGGHLSIELARIRSFLPLLSQWQSAGRIVLVDPKQITKIQDNLTNCRSDDAHVLALVILADVNLIVTDDGDLICDLKDVDVVGYRRKIYPCGEGRPKNLRIYRKLLRSVQ